MAIGRIIGHETKEAISGDLDELVFLAGDDGDVRVVGGRAGILDFFPSEDVDAGQIGFGVAVLARLVCGHVEDFAGPAFDDYEADLS